MIDIGSGDRFDEDVVGKRFLRQERFEVRIAQRTPSQHKPVAGSSYLIHAYLSGEVGKLSCPGVVEELVGVKLLQVSAIEIPAILFSESQRVVR